MKRFLPIAKFVLFLLFIIFTFGGNINLTSNTFAAPVYNHTLGTWTDGYSDNTGLGTRSQVNVDTSDGKLKLTNSGGTYTPPYYTSGYGITTGIGEVMGFTIAAWDSITLTAETPTNTTIKIQVLDGANNIYADTILPGNQAGFTTSTIDLSALPPDRNALAGISKVPRIRLRITLSTTDTNVTPAIDSILVNWTKSQGDLSAATWEASALYSDTKLTGQTGTYADPIYPIIRWTHFYDNNMALHAIRGPGDIIYGQIGGSADSSNRADGRLVALNKNNGDTIWERLLSGEVSAGGYITRTSNESLYCSDVRNDALFVWDGNNEGALKWIYQYVNGHTSSTVNVAPDGTIYTPRSQGSIPSGAIYIYAFNPDGTTKWVKSVTSAGTGAANPGAIALTSTGNVHFIGYRTNGATLFSLSPVDGAVNWSYTAFLTSHIVIDNDNTTYLGNGNLSATASEKKIYAIRSDGSLKWERTIGSTTDYFAEMALRYDNVLMVQRQQYPTNLATLEAINTDDGSLLWTSSSFATQAGLSGSAGINIDTQNGIYFQNAVMYDKTMLQYLDKDGNRKWRLQHQMTGGAFDAFGQPNFDTDGRMYLAFKNWYTNYDSYLFAMYPWTLSMSQSSENVKAGDTINFSVTTAMQQTNLLTGSANQVQIYLDNATRIPLTYSETNSDGDTIWDGSYQIPTDLSAGTHTFTVEAAHAGILTDIETHFEEAPEYSENTGITAIGEFEVDNTAPAEFDLLYPKEFNDNNTQPTLKFKKSSDDESGVASYTVRLDWDKESRYELTGIPVSGDGSAKYVWRDDSTVKVTFVHEESDDSSDDEIWVYFKGLDEDGGGDNGGGGALSEGKHSWEVIAYDTAGNSTEETQEFYIDKNEGLLDDLRLIKKVGASSRLGGKDSISNDKVSPTKDGFNSKSTFSSGVVSINKSGQTIVKDTFGNGWELVKKDGKDDSLKIFIKDDKTYEINRDEMSFRIRGSAIDPYKGSKSDDNQDEYESVASGPELLKIEFKKYIGDSDGDKSDSEYEGYMVREHTFDDDSIKDENGDEKSATFDMEIPDSIESGKYKVTFKLEDKVGNEYESEPFYIVIPETKTSGSGAVLGTMSGLAKSLVNVSGITGSITKEEKVLAETDEDLTNLDSLRLVKVKVVDKKQAPVKNTKVELIETKPGAPSIATPTPKVMGTPMLNSNTTVTSTNTGVATSAMPTPDVTPTNTLVSTSTTPTTSTPTPQVTPTIPITPTTPTPTPITRTTPRIGYTDANGEVTFKGIQLGNYTIKVSYKGKTFDQPITIEDTATKEFHYTIEVQQTTPKYPWWLLIIVIVIISYALFKKRKQPAVSRHIR